MSAGERTRHSSSRVHIATDLDRGGDGHPIILRSPKERVQAPERARHDKRRNTGPVLDVAGGDAESRDRVDCYLRRLLHPLRKKLDPGRDDLVQRTHPSHQSVDEAVDIDGFHLERERNSACDRSGTAVATRIAMRNSALLASKPHQGCWAIVGHQTRRGRALGGAIAGLAGRLARLPPRDTLVQSPCGPVGRETSADNLVFREYGRDSTRVIRGIELAALHPAEQELARQLGVVGVLAKRKQPALELSRRGSSIQSRQVLATRCPVVAFDREPKGVTRRLTDEAARKLIPRWR